MHKPFLPAQQAHIQKETTLIQMMHFHICVLFSVVVLSNMPKFSSSMAKVEVFLHI